MAKRTKTRKVLRRRHTTAGRVLPPVDIRNPSAIGDLLTRIRKGPITVVLVYADWCGHCKDFKPIFERAEKSPNRTAQTVKVNDVMFPQVTDAIKNKLNVNAKPMNVEGYPSVILVDKNGNMIKNVAPVKNEETMKKLMESSGTLAEEAELGSMPDAVPEEGLKEPEAEPGNSLPPLNANSANSTNSARSIGSLVPASQRKSNLANITNEQDITAMPEQVSSSVIEPPSEEAITNDFIQSANSANMGKRQQGGSLLAILGQSAYKLAPAGVLLGLAGATVMRRKRTMKGGRRTVKRRRIQRKKTMRRRR